MNPNSFHPSKKIKTNKSKLLPMAKRDPCGLLGQLTQVPKMIHMSMSVQKMKPIGIGLSFRWKMRDDASHDDPTRLRDR